ERFEDLDCKERSEVLLSGWLPPIEVSRISYGGKVRPHKELSDPHSVQSKNQKALKRIKQEKTGKGSRSPGKIGKHSLLTWPTQEPDKEEKARAPSLELPWDRPSKKDLNICVDEITRPSQFTSSSLGLRVLGDLSSLARLGATCLLTEVISEKVFVLNSLCLLMSQGRAGRGIARFDVGAAELPYLTNEA
ncbi:hypothetical protein L195_g037415, partial [Trifolium pratense]